MNFSGVSSRSAMGQLLRLPLRLIPKSTVIPIIQGPLKGKKWIVGSSSHGCWLGSYEFEKQQLFIQHIEQGAVMYDIGAHVGFYTLLSSHLTGSNGRVIAFEPLPSNVAFIEKHIALNRVTNVTLYEKAVSDQYGSATFSIADSTSMGHLSMDNATDVEETTITVDVISLDRFVSENQLPIPDLMKVDIEGAEYNLLLGAENLLKSHNITLFLATHGSDVHHQCLSFLRNLNYDIINLEDQPLEKSSEIMARKAGI